MKFIKDLDRNDLPEDLQVICDVVGIKLTQDIMLKLAGTIVYFPKKHSDVTKKRYISRHYRGDNVSEITSDLECSRSTVYRLLNEKLV